MAASVASFNKTAYTTSVSSINITKPTGLAEGDYMVAVIQGVHSATFTLTTPAGWTLLEQITTGGTARRTSVFAKVASSSDAAASNFNFAASISIDVLGGTLMRITGATPSPFDTSENDTATPSSATMSFTGSSVAANQDELILMVMVAVDTNTGPITIGSYVSGPTKTWTEVTEDSVERGTNDPVYGIAYTNTTTGITFTSYGATLSASKAEHGGALILIKSVVNATGTNTLYSVSPTLFSQNGVAGTTGTNVLLENSAEFFNQSGSSTAPTQWTNETKPSTTWINDTI